MSMFDISLKICLFWKKTLTFGYNEGGCLDTYLNYAYEP